MQLSFNVRSLSRTSLVLSLFVALGCGEPSPTQSDPTSENAEPIVRTALVHTAPDIIQGQGFIIGVLFTLPEHAHIYWRNSGDSGFATEIEWTLPEGFKAGPLQWPVPRRFYMEEIDDTSYGYENYVFLFSEVTPPTNPRKITDAQFAAEVSWLVCLEDGQCIPESATLTEHSNEDVFTGVIHELPSLLSKDSKKFTDLLKVKLLVNPRTLVLNAVPPWKFSSDAPPPEFFPFSGDPWRLSEPLTVPARALYFDGGPNANATGEFVVHMENPSENRDQRVLLRWGTPDETME